MGQKLLLNLSDKRTLNEVMECLDLQIELPFDRLHVVAYLIKKLFAAYRWAWRAFVAATWGHLEWVATFWLGFLKIEIAYFLLHKKLCTYHTFVFVDVLYADCQLNNDFHFFVFKRWVCSCSFFRVYRTRSMPRATVLHKPTVSARSDNFDQVLKLRNAL